MIKTFAIETSCDDTSLGIVQYDDEIFSCPVLESYSQINDHQPYWWVVPEVAYRLHEEKILNLVEYIWYPEIGACDCVTVTKEPGLPWSLVVGNTVASMLGQFLQKPVYRLNHIYGHIFSLLLDRSRKELPFPWIVLTASGGHNELYSVVWSWESDPVWSTHITDGFLEWKLHIERVGYSLDDAAGEAFDKVARMLGGTYPGWPWISKQAVYWVARKEFQFKRIFLDGRWSNNFSSLSDQNIHNFSFSGMKAQVYQLLQKNPLENLSDADICDICREFQECVADILIAKTLYATKLYGAKTVGLVWWVSANDRLFEKATIEIQHINTTNEWVIANVLRPTKKVYSTDNAAMMGVVWILNHLDFL